MITEHDLKEAIAECEGQRSPTANTCLKLAAYYTIKDKMFPQTTSDEVKQSPPRYSFAAGKVQGDEVHEKTEFLQVIDGIDYSLTTGSP